MFSPVSSASRTRLTCRAVLCAIALAVAIAPAARSASNAASPAPSASQAAATAVPSAAASAASPAVHAPQIATAETLNPSAVVSYLSNVITWYQHLSNEAQLVEEPSETLLYADDHQIANEVQGLAFEYARAAADYIGKFTGKTPPAGAPPAVAGVIGGLGDLGNKAAALQADLQNGEARLKALEAQMNGARGAPRSALASQIAAVSGEIDLTQARIGAIDAIIQFQTGNSTSDQSGGLRAQIDELEKSVPLTAAPSGTQSGTSDTSAPSPSATTPRAEPSGMTGAFYDLLAARNKSDQLAQTIALTTNLANQIKLVREPLIEQIGAIDERGDSYSKGMATADVATLRTREKMFRDLIAQHKDLVALTLPLTKQVVLLESYVGNLERWQRAVNDRARSDLRRLIIRTSVVAIALALIFLGAAVWRQLTFRYVQDIRRRGQVLAARRLVVGILVVLILMINFSDQLSSFATVLGFAAAGVAVALQNVILSIAGYFFLIGRFGIRVGDRVQIGGVVGDVVEIGLVKLSLMELGGDGNHRMPTGRVVVFSNAIVFQPSGNFFKQAPGTSFVWNEIRLKLAADCDYRLAEKRLTDAVEQVYARYRETIQRDYRHLERELNILLESPKPQSRLSLGADGLNVTIRYPAETRNAAQIADEVARRVLDAIAREPSLRLVTGAANIESVSIPTAGDEPQPEKKSA
jgi:small-conductance mechanosensitive channel